ncbi:BQ5605_C036g11533 [Microbotryum silenes-dioicae]|uniref:BQ5605_C036g11533 protein n=1 Tax=Microbotryum silenes-dioicae TaxID=796604 RepID=A0A2X0MJZ1_9BASI|nr:BQ5605_C036g11533 [Microbotryum silenes-dioicae]
MSSKVKNRASQPSVADKVNTKTVKKPGQGRTTPSDSTQDAQVAI